MGILVGHPPSSIPGELSSSRELKLSRTRELENLLERLVILSEDGVIRVENLPANVRSFISEKKIPKPVMSEEGLDLTNAVEQFENRLIDEALRRTKGNKQAAARLLGLKRTTLVAKLRRRRGGPVVTTDMTGT